MAIEEYSALQDLETILRKNINDHVTLVDYKTTSLLPPGENYGSLMLKVVATIKRSKDAPEEELNLVAKLIPTSAYALNFMKTAITFEKEIFMFEKLAPAYRQIEQETELKKDNLKDLFPQYYGGRLIKDEKNPERALENAILLLKNITTDGFKNADRKKGLDLEHTKLAISELARFHGLGMALMKLKPNVFAEAKKLMTEFPFEMVDSEINKFVEQTFKVLSQDPRSAKYIDRIQESMKDIDWKEMMSAEPVEPWITITHGDFWVNNIMFRDGKSGVDDIKLIDFQIMRVYSPVTDLPYFLFASTSPDVQKNHFDEILDVYYNRLIDVLKKTGCDITPYSRKNFDDELNKVAKLDLFRCIIAVKFITLDVSEHANIDMDDMSNIFSLDGSKLYFDRVYDILKKYDEMGWL